jgi:hypothetical protein
MNIMAKPSPGGPSAGKIVQMTKRVGKNAITSPTKPATKYSTPASTIPIVKAYNPQPSAKRGFHQLRLGEPHLWRNVRSCRRGDFQGEAGRLDWFGDRTGEAMSKKARIQQARLVAMELEFAKLLPERLAECAGGRWGLFGQNATADPEDRYWTWPEAKHLRQLASDIRIERSAFGEINPLAERFLGLCGAGMPNAEGEPKLAAGLLAELHDDAHPTNSR